MKKIFSQAKGITLISLIITIVIIAILIGISMTGIRGNEGVVNKTKVATSSYELSQIKEKVEIYALKNSDKDFDVTDMIVEGTISMDEAKKYYNSEGSIESNKIISIKTAEELAKIGVDANYPFDGYYILENDIDLSSICSETKGTWTPIANYTANTSNIFTGVFNGNNHKIKGLYINTTKLRQALFGANSGVIKNIKMTDGEITGKGYVASVVALNYGQVLNCQNEIPITIKNGKNSTGGVVAYSQGENNCVKNCCNLADIISEDTIDGWTCGVIGKGDDKTIIENCYNTGEITAANGVSRNNRRRDYKKSKPLL